MERKLEDYENEVIARLKHEEGYVDHVYPDHKGVPTFGYGTNLTQPFTMREREFIINYLDAQYLLVHMGDLFSRAVPNKGIFETMNHLSEPEVVAEYLLKSKYFQAYNDLIGFVSHWETGFEWDDIPVNAKKALLDMSYNMGITKLMKFHDMFSAIQQKDWETAAKECLDSVYSKVDLKKSNRDEENAELLRSCKLDSNPADDNLT